MPVGLIEAIVCAAAAQDPAYAALGLDLLGWFRLGLRSEADARACAAALAGLAGVRDVVLAPEPASAPAEHVPWSVDRSGEQTYRAAAPRGVGADEVHMAGALGEGVRFGDVESAWAPHPDLPRARRHADVMFPTLGAHGVRTLGVVLGVHQRRPQGVRGIAPHVAAVHLFGNLQLCAATGLARETEQSDVDALAVAARHLRRGDVLLLEAQSVSAEGAYAPLEACRPAWEWIRTLTALGVTVVQPAGNGARDLGGLLPPDGEDSGAIIVSAAVHEPAGWVCEPASNHGARADCFASGRGVVTTSLFLDTARSATAPTIVPTITDAFANTSAAGAIVAGCAVAVQGMVRARWGVPGSVAGVRALLRAHGTPAGPGPAIGVMPDLAAIAAALAAAPAPP